VYPVRAASNDQLHPPSGVLWLFAIVV